MNLYKTEVITYVYINSFKIWIHIIYELMQKEPNTLTPFLWSGKMSGAATAIEDSGTANFPEESATAAYADAATSSSVFFSSGPALIFPSASLKVLTHEAEYAASVATVSSAPVASTISAASVEKLDWIYEFVYNMNSYEPQVSVCIR